MIPVGTLCLVVAADYPYELLNGMECTVIGHVHVEYATCTHTHAIRMRGGSNGTCTRGVLMPIAPPAQFRTWATGVPTMVPA